MPSEPRLSEPRRLHPVSLLFNLLQGLRAMAIPIVTVVFVGQGSQWMVWALPFLGISVLAQPLLKFLAFRYRFGQEGLLVRDGILTKNERNIPYARIQNVDIVQNPLHRAFDVAIVKIETASGGSPEAVIRVLSLDAVLEMRRRVAEGRGKPLPGEEGGREEGLDASGDEGALVATSDLKDLVVHGLVANRGMVVVGAALGAVWQAGFDPLLEPLLDRLKDVSLLDLPSPRAALDAGDWPFLALFAAFSLLVFVSALLAISVAWSMLKYGGFTLRLAGSDLRARYGAFTRVQASIPRRRVQRVILHQALIHRVFGRVSAYADTAGSGSGGEGDPVSAERLWLAPAARSGLARTIASAALDTRWAPETMEWRPLDRRAGARLVRRGWFVAAALATVASGATLASAFAGYAWIGLLALLLGPLLHLRARLYVRFSAWTIAGGLLVHRSGWLARRTVIVRLNKIQVIRRNQNPFDRRWGMASLLVDTAGSSRGQSRGIEIAFLPETVAAETAETLRAASARSDFSW